MICLMISAMAQTSGSLLLKKGDEPVDVPFRHVG